MNSKWRNYGLWLAIFSFVPLFLQALATYGVHWVLPGNYNVLVTSFLALFVIAGVLSDPTTNNLGLLGDSFMSVGYSPWRTVRLRAAIFAFIPLLIQGLGVYNIHVILPGNYGDVVNALLFLLTLSGLLYVSPNTLTLNKLGNRQRTC